MTPTYDADGNLTYDGVFTYGYDAEGRLLSVKQGSTAVASYAYDAQGRRKAKTVGSTSTVYVTDADNREVLEYDGTSGAIERWYAFGRGPDAVLGQMNVAAGTRETMIPDIQGSIIATLDSGTGALAKSGYQAFGENPAVTTGTYRYTARRFDPETAGSTSQPSGLYYYRARMYSPNWGRFLQPDPIGYAAGPNLYAYVNNDPLNNIDPLGKDATQIGILGSLTAFGVTGVGSIGIIIDNLGNVVAYISPGGGAGAGAGAFAGITGQYSPTARNVTDMYGPFVNTSLVAAATGGASADVFGGVTSDSHPVIGVGATGGLGFAASASTTLTATIPISPVINLGKIGIWIAQQLAPSATSVSANQNLK